AGKWSGQCYLTKEATSSTQRTRDAARGIGYLMIKFLIEKYGLESAGKFVGSVVMHGNSVESASQDELGAAWKSVNSLCASYVHHSAHA
ncbi:MAG TPA: hypothetical protein VKB69_14590, partial [Micromonosporaceae bacterium]|nr:hypothetical protein [Micromonosporaceae bacterium]